MMDIENVIEFLKTCPELGPEAVVYTDFSEEKPVNFGLMDEGARVTGKNILGKRSFCHSYRFLFRLPTSTDSQRRDNLGRIQRFHQWVLQQGDDKNFPQPLPGFRATHVDARPPALDTADTSGKTGRYQMELCVHYEQQ